ncbi:MAG: EAL domain-containing protein [Candidatus Omnitrophica bacterium]|nr:EAL domain-containing protein [Candidatus Omnitrophota bacterium]
MPDKRLSDKSILLIDDDDSLRQTLAMLFETRGYKVTTAATGQEALQRVASRPDLILLDLMLPDQNGFDVCRKLKSDAHASLTPIIILSAKILSGDIVEGLYLGADDYLTKPFDFEELVARVEAVMRRASVFRKSLTNQTREEEVIVELRRIIEDRRVSSFFQPIYALPSGDVFGYEILTRPDSSALLANPELLFKAALQFGCYEELEFLGWEMALQRCQGIPPKQKMFFNCNPYFVEGTQISQVKNLFAKHNVDSRDVVLEITERSAIGDYHGFFNQLRIYRDYGFSFAVDDVGGGYSSLESIVETKPEIVKIDYHIINGIDRDNIKKSLVKFVLAFSRENHIRVVAEGIETEAELNTVQKLGVELGQGYYLCRPKQNISSIPPNCFLAEIPAK